jgi:hypothetical protein
MLFSITKTVLNSIEEEATDCDYYNDGDGTTSSDQSTADSPMECEAEKCNNNLDYGFDNERIRKGIVAVVPPKYKDMAPNMMLLRIRNRNPCANGPSRDAINAMYDDVMVLFDTPIEAIRLDKQPSDLGLNPVHALVLTKNLDNKFGEHNINIYNVTDRKMVLANYPIGVCIELGSYIGMRYVNDYDIEISYPGCSMVVQLPTNMAC